ncbi:MAG: Gfo/Idh/MocA family oxidoreductase [Clostridia bacterium]|nr:Gfo/Idh/MocA family oxidoreductase [Clostridia bacterium]
MRKIRVGVMGVHRGNSMIQYCRIAENAEVVAICDKWEEGLLETKKKLDDPSIAYYTSFDDFIKHDMDAVVLANYANEHAPFAIRAMKEGKHVFSEVLPVQNMKEAVELCEAVEETGMIYNYGENYCYMPAPSEMRRLYREGKIGEFEYGEGEYVHNCESIWPSITYGESDHWRNNMFATFYCTHSLGPIVHITGLRPVSVVGFEGTRNERGLRVGRRSGQFGMEMVTFENGGIAKSIHGDLYRNSIWYTIYGSKGRMESAREDAEEGGVNRIYVNADLYSGEYDGKPAESYEPVRQEASAAFGHGGSDFYSMFNFIEKIRGNDQADVIDVYEALDMFLPGIFAYRSILKGGIPMEIPNLRDKSIRDLWRNDTACTDPKAAGDQLLPCMSAGNPDIPDEVFARQRALWLEERAREKGEK